MFKKSLIILTLTTSLAFSPTYAAKAQPTAPEIDCNQSISDQIPGCQLSNLPAPKLKLLVAHSQTNDITKWPKTTFSSQGQYVDFDCSTRPNIEGMEVVGISDYEDGIMRTHYNTFLNDGKDETSSHPFAPAKTDLRQCKWQNVEAKNWDSICETNWDQTIKSANQVLSPMVNCEAMGRGYVGDRNPVYAFQGRFEYRFRKGKEATESEKYRKYTGLSGTYEGVVFTMTWYTARDLSDACANSLNTDSKEAQSCLTKSAYKPWNLPTKDNANGGWLVYGIKNNRVINTNPETPKPENPQPENWWTGIDVEKIPFESADTAEITVGKYTLSRTYTAYRSGEEKGKSCLGTRVGMLGFICFTVEVKDVTSKKLITKVDTLPKLHTYLGALDSKEKADFLGQVTTNSEWFRGLGRYESYYISRANKECTSTHAYYWLNDAGSTYEIKKIAEKNLDSEPVACE